MQAENVAMNLADVRRYQQQLNSTNGRVVRKALNMVYQDMIRGICARSLFSDIVKNMANNNDDIKKIVYQILILWSNYQSNNMLLLCFAFFLFHFFFGCSQNKHKLIQQ